MGEGWRYTIRQMTRVPAKTTIASSPGLFFDAPVAVFAPSIHLSSAHLYREAEPIGYGLRLIIWVIIVAVYAAR
ncbi:hypothetical protein CIK92_03345 [Prevotella sp. P4-67]|nr:hypothetical protein CIK92_03345 [Prevotella sp. P4-67]